MLVLKMSLCSEFPLPPPEAFLEDTSLSSRDFVFDVWQWLCPVSFLHDMLWLIGGSHGETVMG